MIKEYVFFINTNIAFSLTKKKVVSVEELAHKKVYGLFYSSHTKYKQFDDVDDLIIKENIDREFKEQQSLSVLYKTINTPNHRHIYIEQKEFVKTLIDDFNVYSLVRVEQVFDIIARKNNHTNKTILIGIFNTFNNTLIYNIYQNNELLTTTTGIKPISEALQDTSDAVIKESLNTIENVYRVKFDDYLIFGYNRPYEEIIQVLNSIRYKETFNREFQNNQTITIKKALSIIAIVLAIYPLLFLFLYEKDNILESYQKNQINKANAILSNLADNKKQLYREKGKTIILEDEIDFNKLADIIYPVSQTYPNTIDYATDKSNLTITLIYKDTIMAYTLHRELTNSHIDNIFSIAPDTKMAKVVINLPVKLVTRGL